MFSVRLLNISEIDVLIQLTQPGSVSPYLLSSKKPCFPFPSPLTLFSDSLVHMALQDGAMA